MDLIDEQIVHCLQYNGRASFRQIGQIVGVSEQTVARRYSRMRGAGALRIVVLPTTLTPGTDNWVLRIVCRPASADRLADVLAERDDVAWVNVAAGGAELSCMARIDSGPSGTSGLLRRLPHTEQVLSFTAVSIMYGFVGGESEWLALGRPLTAEQRQALSPVPWPPPRNAGGAVAITDDDGPMLAALARDGRTTAATLARETGWSGARVAARLEELLSTGTVAVDVDIVAEQFGHPTAAYLWMTVAPGDLHATGQALARLPQTAFTAAVTGTSNLMAAVTVRNSAELYEFVTGEVGALAGVRQVETVPILRRVKQAGSRVRNGRLEPGVTLRTGPASAEVRRRRPAVRSTRGS